jgi:hypothetical protein
MNERFSNLLDEALERFKAGESVDAILADYPTHRDGLELLLSAAQELSALEHVPPPASSEVGLATFLAEAKDLEAQARSNRNGLPRFAAEIEILRQWWHCPRIRLALGMGMTVVLLFVMVSATFQLSSHSLPGEWLYPVKLASEELHLSFTRDQVARTEYTLLRARTRVREIQTLAETGRPIPAATLKRLDRSLQDGLTSVALVQDAEMRRLLADLEGMALEQTAVLLELEQETHQQAHPLLAQMRQSLEQTRAFASAGQADVNAFRLNAQLSAFMIGGPWDGPTAAGIGIPAQREEPGTSPQREMLQRTAPAAVGSPAMATPSNPTDAAANGFTVTSPSSPILARTASPTLPGQAPEGPLPQPTDTIRPTTTSSPTAQPSSTPEPSPTWQPTATPTAPEPSSTSQAEASQEPTETPEPTATPKPTKTPRPTHTPRPTKTPRPTHTPRPTKTPKPSDTPEPTEMVEPTDMPEPTPRLEPTEAPAPTATPHPGGPPVDKPKPTKPPKPDKPPKP